MADKPVTREEKYLAYLTGDYTGEIPKPITRKEKYLYELCLKGIGGEISPEEIKAAVNEYLEKNPVKPGATTEQAQQIEQNKTDIASLKVETGSLKEDLSNKITKFYASNQGETHLADSDNGKIMDMILYGKSEQKQYTGYQLLNDIFEKGSIDVDTGELVESDSNLRTKFFSKIEAGKEYHIELPKDVVIAFRYYADENTYISSYAARNSTRFSTPKSATLLKAVLINNNIYSNNILLSDVMDSYIYEPYTGGQSSPSPNYPQEIKSVVNPTVKVTNKDGLKVQSVTLNNITINAIPVLSDGDYMDGSGQQWICDEVDCERGTYIQRIKKYTFSGDEAIRKSGTYQPGGTYTHETIRYQYNLDRDVSGKNFSILCSHFGSGRYATNVVCSYDGYVFFFTKSDDFQTENDFSNFLKQQKNDGHPVELFYILATPIETPLTSEKINALKSLSTNYPVTNISVNSEQLDGYTVFNYPISMANGWNYVKQQLNDNRDYIYDMDIQSAEAYVNSEYAVALTELEV